MQAGYFYHRLKSENMYVKLSNSYIVTRSAQYGQSPFLEVYFAVPLKNVAETMKLCIPCKNDLLFDENRDR